MKKKEEKVINLSADELIERIVNCSRHKSKNFVKCFFLLLILMSSLLGTCVLKGKGLQTREAKDIITMASAPLAVASAKKELISIPAGTVKANPFLPYRDISGAPGTEVPDYELVEPPEAIQESSDAARVMDTIVSGILYDKFSPSAILNIEGNDYLVKKGDVVNNYKVLCIAQDSVTVKLGNNTYKAGIGEILTEGTVNYNNVSNLNNKFGGVK